MVRCGAGLRHGGANDAVCGLRCGPLTAAFGLSVWIGGCTVGLSIGKRRGVVMNYRLQDLRAFAAIAVVLYHMAIRIDELYGIKVFGGVFNRHFGFYGVLTFFFISGYLMAKLAESSTPWDFIVQRIIRIYPAFFAAIIYAFVLPMIIFGSSQLGDPLAYFLLPLGPHYGPLHIEWSLNYEVFFYLIVSIFCLRPLNRYYWAFLLAWLAAVLITLYQFSAYGTSQFPLFHEAFFSAWNIAFILGGLAFYATRLPGVQAAVNLAGPPVLLLTIFSLLLPEVFPESTRVLFVCAVIGIPTLWYISLPRSDMPRQGYAKLLKAIGDRSYGLYLVHQVTGACLQGVVFAQFPGTPFLAYFALFGISFTAGMAMGEIDVRTHAWLKARVSRRSRPNSSTFPAAGHPVNVSPASPSAMWSPHGRTE